MTKANTRIISSPFDARHVGGVSIPGATVPIAGLSRASTVLEPDEAPSHMFAATGNIEVPRRSNSIAHSLSRPSLRLKTSLSLLKGQSKLESIDTPRRQKSMDRSDVSPVQILRKKPSTSSLWQRAHHDAPTRQPPVIREKLDTAMPEAGEKMFNLTHKSSTMRVATQHATNPYEFDRKPQSPSPPPPPPIEDKPLMRRVTPVVRPKRADSGTAIELDGLPVSERPLGFREILAKNSLAERMALYKRTRDYWATADHGLGEWVGKAGRHKPLVFPV